MKKVISFIFCLTIISAQTFDNQKIIANLKGNLNFLASDILEGREAGTRAEKISSLFLANEMQKSGIKPFGDSNTYFHNFKMYSISYDKTSEFAFLNDDDTLKMKLGEDIATFEKKFPDENLKNFTADIVFAGYGIEAEEFDYNDYENVDVKDKVVLIFAGEPASDDEDFFNGTKNSKYSDGDYKLKAAEKYGAKAVLVISSGRMFKYWKYFARRTLNPGLVEKNEFEKSSQLPYWMLSKDILVNILEDEKVNFNDLLEKEKSGKLPEPFMLNEKFSSNLKVSKEVKNLRNVVGIIEGNDPELKDEYICVTAHYDHVGVRGDQVFNGADDNASGTVSALQVGQLFAEMKSNERSVVVALFTAEEKGLIGSKVFVEQKASLKNINAVVNLDMVARGSVDSIHCIGSFAASDEFGELVKEANEKSAGFTLDYQNDDINKSSLFYQSDHYSFAKKNIPVVFFFDNMRNDLHRPSDDYEKINFIKMVKSVKLAYEVVKQAANEEDKFELNSDN